MKIQIRSAESFTIIITYLNFVTLSASTVEDIIEKVVSSVGKDIT